jgi:hypothetical protein
MIDLGPLRALSPERWEALCRYLQPQGKKEGHRWFCGSVAGEPGYSFNVNWQTGIFGDFAAEGKQRKGPIDYWMAVRNVDFRTAVRDLSGWLGCCPPENGAPLTHTRKETLERVFFPPGLSAPTEADLWNLSKSRSISIEALRIAALRGFIQCFDDRRNGRCWLFTDKRHRCGLRRRLDNLPFILRGGSSTKSAACPGSDMHSPLGYLEAQAFPAVAIVEGAPDALSVIAHAWASGVEERVAPICMPSRTANFTESVLGYLQGKRARIFIDHDDPGQEAAQRWAAQLARADISVDGFKFGGLITTDAQPVKDLNDALAIDYDCWEQHRTQIDSLFAQLL